MTSTRALSVLGALGLGATLMYALDPVHGRRRRALARDKLIYASRRTGEAFQTGTRDLSNRVAGLWSRLRGPSWGTDAGDDVVTARVRERIGRVVRHPKSVHVMVNHGVARLDGPVLADEVDDLLKAVRDVSGVTAIDNRLLVHERHDDVPGLQGEGTPPRRSWRRTLRSPAVRLVAVSGAAIATAAVLAARRR